MKRRVWKLMRMAGVLLMLAVLAATVFFALVYNGYFGPLPDEEEVGQLEAPAATRVYDSRGNLIGRFYRFDRTPVSLDQVAPVLVTALVATEDKRFYTHRGLDWRSLLRVLVKSVLLGQRSAGGGSTLTLQLAKNLYPRQHYKVLYYPINKTREAIITWRLEQVYTKEEILELYLNTVSFGMDVYGVESAAWRYFNKPAARLDTLEAAVLVAMLKATTTYNPVLHPAAARNRRNVVLHRLADAGRLDSATLQRLVAMPLVLDYRPPAGQPAAYFLARVRSEAGKLLEAYNRTHNTRYNLTTDGLQITTTLDYAMQQEAEQALKAHLKSLQALFDRQWEQQNGWLQHARLLEREIGRIANGRPAAELERPRQMYIYTSDSVVKRLLSPVDSLKYYLKILRAGFVALDPGSGAVRTWVGGIDYRFFPYDHVDYRARRQVGSTFKPLVYAAALEKGVPPCRYYKTRQKSFRLEDGVWRPSNDNEAYEGKYSLAGALQQSVNTVSVKVLQDAGIDRVIVLARNLGIRADLPAVPSIALGTPAISLLEMTAAYTAFVNGGMAVEPFFIQKITDREGKVLYERPPARPVRAMSRRTAALIRVMLEGVADHGTARSLRTRYRLNNDLGGKTGTTQNNADGWFIAITPRLVAGTWVGGVYPQISFSDTRLGQGATMALPVFAGFYQRLNQNAEFRPLTRARFPALPASWQAALDCEPFRPGFRLKQLFNKKKNKPGRDRKKKSRKRRKQSGEQARNIP